MRAPFRGTARTVHVNCGKRTGIAFPVEKRTFSERRCCCVQLKRWKSQPSRQIFMISFNFPRGGSVCKGAGGRAVGTASIFFFPSREWLYVIFPEGILPHRGPRVKGGASGRPLRRGNKGWAAIWNGVRIRGFTPWRNGDSSRGGIGNWSLCLLRDTSIPRTG